MIRRVLSLMLCLSTTLPVVAQADAAERALPAAVADALHLKPDHPVARWANGKLDASDSV